MKKTKTSITWLPWILFLGVVIAQITPVEDLHHNPPRVWALTHATLHPEPGTVIEDGSILIRNGIIEKSGTDFRIPEDATQIDLHGTHVYAGFIDGWVEADPTDTVKTGRDHWNTYVNSHRKAFDGNHLAKDQREEFHKLGFTTVHMVGAEGIFRGRSALVQLDESRTPLPASGVQVAAFEYGGWNSDEYPSALLGTIALIRQTLFDAGWYRDARDKAASYPDQNEPVPENRDLEALSPLVTDHQPLLFETRDEQYALRAAKIAREFDLPLWIKGSGYEYRRLLDIARSDPSGEGPFIILPIDYPASPEIAHPYDALQYTTAQLKHWELAPDNLKRLIAAGIPVALTKTGVKPTKQFRENLQESIHRGLTPESALASLTTIPAEKFGVADQVGKIAPGYIANLVITEDDYFSTTAPVREVWIGGDRHKLDSPPRINPLGTWSFESPSFAGTLDFSGSIDHLSGSITLADSALDLAHLRLDDDRLSWTWSHPDKDTSYQVRVTGHVEADGKRAAGQLTLPDGHWESWVAKLTESEPDSSEWDIPSKRDALSEIPVVSPDGAFGFETPPSQPDKVLINDGFVWTCGPRGILNGWDVLVEDGKISRLAPDISLPQGTAVIVDATGKFVTPGLIDCHSHSAAASINEGTQSVTSEVRIQDVLNADDMSIYRELAGGLTMANILHGSANSIGGQNAVIKLRWGVTADELIDERAPAGIKFALGENVKQSNWGDDFTTRYPQTRMGVEQIIRDAFTAAREYEKRWKLWNGNSKYRQTHVPPRRDLELEALVEVLNGERMIHCHSYRQDEILMLTRVAEDFGFTVGVFQHVLEGYKVAERIAEHGAGASTFSDWWAYKYEVIDAIPFNGTLMNDVGVNVSFNSDSDELARRLNRDAAKAVKYGGMSEEDALNLVTINPARQLQIDKWVGSIEVGKDADFVIWSGHPFAPTTVCEETWIDGRQYYSRQRDAQLHDRDREIRNRIIQHILNTEKRDGPAMNPEPPGDPKGKGCLFIGEGSLEWKGGNQ